MNTIPYDILTIIVSYNDNYENLCNQCKLSNNWKKAVYNFGCFITNINNLEQSIKLLQFCKKVRFIIDDMRSFKEEDIYNLKKNIYNVILTNNTLDYITTLGTCAALHTLYLYDTPVVTDAIIKLQISNKFIQIYR